MNQRKLYEQIDTAFSDERKITGRFSGLIKNKGRTERREVMASQEVAEISEGWVGLKQIVKVLRWTKNKNKETQDTAFYITSITSNAQVLYNGIRSHWGIENSLHWVKDVTFREDASKIRTGNAPQNTSILRNMAINIFRLNEYTNLAQAQRLVANDIKQLKKLMKK